MERIRENQRKMPFSSSRRSSRGIVSKQSSGIWKVENEGIDSIRERYRIMDHYRLNGRMRRGSLIANESSDESFDGEMAEERTMSKAWFKVYDEIIGVPVPRRARSGLKRRPQDSFIAAEPSNASKGSREEMVPISESEVEVAKFLFGLTRLNSQDSDAAADTFQSSSVPVISTISKDSKRKKSRHIQTDETGKSSVTITCNSKSDWTTNQVNDNSSVPISSTSGQQADSSSCIKEMAPSSPKHHKISSPNNSCQTKMDAQFLGPQNSVPIPILAEEKPSPTSHINAKTLTSPDHHEQPNSNATCKTQHEQTEQLSEMESQMKQDLPPVTPK